MSRDAYFEELKALAREKRNLHRVNTAAFGLREIRKIYRVERIRIDYWPLPSKIKAIYMCADGDYSVALQRNLPDEPKLFALTHELKHHYRDQETITGGMIHCGDYNANELIEKGAEVFAAEFIYPEDEFAEDIRWLGVTQWKPEDVVRFKRGHCKAKVSYKFICKRLERLNLIVRGQFDRIHFRKLEDSIFGVPFHRLYQKRRAS
ncbi:MAG TPA: ImmA/IrrE family metallo-endopeptidase [Terracidiphilus sp.]|jgi:Zn-dependent peptidase ImmA (M78 family)